MRLIPASEVARMLCVTTGTLSNWRRARRGPQGWVFTSYNRVMYPEQALKDYLESLTGEQPQKTERTTK